jgi:hypothetical protein
MRRAAVCSADSCNAIDLFMRVLDLSFHDAMCQITSEPLAMRARSSG